MRLHGLQIENFKRVQAFDLTFGESGTIEICGKNGQGKSSVIDAIWAAIAGKEASPDQPIRNGARTASVFVDLGELRVRREWDLKGGTKLIVTDARGAKQGSPQTLLDSLFSKLAFDPMEFARAKPAAQAETLRRVSGLDFSAIDARRAAVYSERTEVNKAVKSLEAQLGELPEVEPTEEVSVAALQVKLQEANAHNNKLDQIWLSIERKNDEIRLIGRQLEDLKNRIKELETRSEQITAERDELSKGVGEPIETSPILAEIGEVEATNRRARQYRDRQAVADNLASNRNHSARLTSQIEQIDDERLKILERTQFPVPGLSLDGDCVTFNGVPLAQASSAEQIRVSLAMSAALNPRLRLIIIKEGSLLDDRSLALVAEWAEQNEYQVIVERVADSAKGFGVVIEEGLVKDTRELVGVPQ